MTMGGGAAALDANRRKLSPGRFSGFQGVVSTRRKNGSLQGSKIFLVGLCPDIVSLKVRRHEDFSRSRSRLPAPTIRAAGRSG